MSGLPNTRDPLPAWASVQAAGDIGAFLAAWLQADLLSGEEAAAFARYYASYRRSFGPYMRHHYRNQTRELQDCLQGRARLRILEVGCGCGTESLWMALHGHAVRALDVSEKLLRVARARKQLLENAAHDRLDCEFELQSVLDLRDGGFDLIWMEQAFHHLEPRPDIVAKLGSLLAPGGRLIISESNAWNPLLQLMLYRLRGTKTVIRYNGVTWGNERVLTPGSLRRLLQPQGIEMESMRYYRMLPNRRWAETLTGRAGIFDDSDHAWLRPLYTHYNFVGRKRA